MSELRYTRVNSMVWVKIEGMTNHELRAVLLGIWRRLDEDDREDFVQELSHYKSRPDEELPGLAYKIAFGEREK